MHQSRFLLTTGTLLLLAMSARAGAPRFFDDDPLREEPVTQDVKSASRYEPGLTYSLLINLFGKPGEPELGQPAGDINTIGEVLDGPFFVNRAGRLALTPELVARASNTGSGPAGGSWIVVAAKSDGITPGFTIRDQAGDLWFIKFDPPGWRGMATGAEVISAKLFWALGYHTVEYHLAQLRTESLVIGPEARVSPPGEPERPMTADDVAWLLRRTERDADGSHRVLASKAAPGQPMGRLRFEGTRPDDPNDLVPAEHRRSLRGYGVFSAWLNHVDAKAINSLVVLVNEGGRRHLRRYLLDFGSTLGSAAIGPREQWQGEETLVERPSEIGRRVLAGGLRRPEWRGRRFFVAPSVGRLPIEHEKWDPRQWQPHSTNAAFRHARPDDQFWAADKLASITEEMIGAAVREGQLGDPVAERALFEMIAARRRRILETYLPAVNPIVRPALRGRQLTFENAAVQAGVAKAPRAYQAAWFTFDNGAGTSSPLASTQGVDTVLAVPDVPAAAAFIRVDLSAEGGEHASWARPVSVYFRRNGAEWTLVGFDRAGGGDAGGT